MVESSLARVPSAANGARRIAFNHTSTQTAPVPLLTLDEMTLEARCGGSPAAELLLNVNSTSSADLNWVFNFRDNDQGATSPVAAGKAIGANTKHNQVTTVGALDGFEGAEGQLIYHNAKRVIALTLHLVANANTGRCQVTGVAAAAPG